MMMTMMMDDSDDDDDGDESDEPSQCSTPMTFQKSHLKKSRKGYIYKKLDAASSEDCQQACCDASSCASSFLLDGKCYGVICDDDGGSCRRKHRRLPRSTVFVSNYREEANRPVEMKITRHQQQASPLEAIKDDEFETDNSEDDEQPESDDRGDGDQDSDSDDNDIDDDAEDDNDNDSEEGKMKDSEEEPEAQPVSEKRSRIRHKPKQNKPTKKHHHESHKHGDSEEDAEVQVERILRKFRQKQ